MVDLSSSQKLVFKRYFAYFKKYPEIVMMLDCKQGGHLVSGTREAAWGL